MFDDSLMLIDGDTDGSLTTTGTYTGVDVQESPASGYTFLAVVPAAAATTTLDIDIEQADTDADGSYARLISFAQITAAGLQAVHVAVPKRYVRASVSVAGTSPDFGAVSLGIAPTGQFRFWNA